MARRCQGRLTGEHLPLVPRRPSGRLGREARIDRLAAFRVVQSLECLECQDSGRRDLPVVAGCCLMPNTLAAARFLAVRRSDYQWAYD